MTCVGTPWFAADNGYSEVITVPVDERGRWFARLDPTLTWSVWSVQSGKPQAEAETFTISDVRHGIRPGHQEPLQLLNRRERQRIVLQGTDAWPEITGLHVAAVEIGRHVLPATADGEGHLPPLPHIEACHITDGEGLLLAVAHAHHNPDGILLATLHPPRELGVRVVDEQQTALAGAEVHLDLSTDSRREGWLGLPGQLRLRLLGRTGDDGLLTVRVPAIVKDFVLCSDIKLLARKDGFMWTGGGIRAGGHIYSGREPLASPPDHILNITLLEGGWLKATPAGVREAELVASVPGMDSMSPRRVPMRFGKLGHARLPFQGHEPSGESIMALRSVGEDGTVCWSHLDGQRRRADLSSRRLRLQVVGPEGGPPHGARAVLRPLRTWLDLPLPLDAAGRATVDLGPGDWMVFVFDGHAASWRCLRASDGGRDAVDWSLRLTPLDRAAVTVVDPRGNPAAFGLLEFGLNSSGEVDADRGNPDERNELWNFAHRLLHHRRLDAQGRTDLPMLLPELQWELVVPRCRDLEPKAAQRRALANAAALVNQESLTLEAGNEHRLELDW